MEGDEVVSGAGSPASRREGTVGWRRTETSRAGGRTPSPGLNSLDRRSRSERRGRKPMATGPADPDSKKVRSGRPGTCRMGCCDYYYGHLYDVDFVEESIEELRGLRANERRRVLDEIDQQLRANPAMVTRRRKMLGGVIPPWDQVRPVWQLRVGDLRVFYDVDARGKRVTIRAVRRKV